MLLQINYVSFWGRLYTPSKRRTSLLRSQNDQTYNYVTTVYVKYTITNTKISQQDLHVIYKHFQENIFNN